MRFPVGRDALERLRAGHGAGRALLGEEIDAEIAAQFSGFKRFANGLNAVVERAAFGRQQPSFLL